MSWFDTTGLASLAKTALKEAQKKIDKVLDIQEEEDISSAETFALDSAALRKLPGAANRALLTSSPNDEVNILEKHGNVGTEICSNSSLGQSADIDSFSDRSVHNMVATVSAAEAALEIASPTNAIAVTRRQSDSGSAEVLSSPLISHCSDHTATFPESVKLTTASNQPDPTASNPDLTSTSKTDSLVIISGTSDTEEEEDRTVTMQSSNPGDSDVHVSEAGESANSTTSAANNSDARHTVASDSSNKLLLSLEEVPYELQTIDSDSTQSFEDVQDVSDSALISSSNAKPKSCSKSDASPPNSNDELETATSSDIEIISNPNGDSSSTHSNTRTSPLKQKKVEPTCALTTAAPIAPARKGHCRESSEISILSMESHSEEELEKLIHRITELNSIVEARELRLLQSERENSLLQERNNELQSLIDARNYESSEEYTKRLSALEKKFQASIRERESLRMQIKELQSRIPRDDLTKALNESKAMVAELRLEGEKLSKEILQQSNIIKKLRAKEKSSDVQLKNNKEQLESATDELERLKKTLSAREEVERTQIEAVHKMTSENQKLEKENMQLSSRLEDALQKLNTLQRSFEAVKSELQQRSKQQSDLSRTAETVQAAEKEKEFVKAENVELRRQLQELREKLRSTEQSITKREQELREENRQLLVRVEAAELRAESSTQEISLTTIPLMRHLESLQQTLNQRTSNWNKEEKDLLEKLEAYQMRIKALEHVEATGKEKLETLRTRCFELEEKLANAMMQEEETKIALQLQHRQTETDLNRQIAQLNKNLETSNAKIKLLEEKENDLQQKLQAAESKQSATQEFFQREQSSTSLTELGTQGVDPTHRTNSPAISTDVNSLEDAMCASIDWQIDDMDCVSNSGRPQTMHGVSLNIMGHSTSTLEHLQSLLKQRDGELAQQQWELARLQGERALLHEEISSLTLELENVKEKLQSSESLQHRYDALLQMYGEKVERTEELELDLKECKEAYKAQIQELLADRNT